MPLFTSTFAAPLLLLRALSTGTSNSTTNSRTSLVEANPKCDGSFSFLFSFLFLFDASSLINYTVSGILRYFKEHGWPSSTLFETPPTSDEDRAKLIDTLQVFVCFFFFSYFLLLVSLCVTLLHDMVVSERPFQQVSFIANERSFRCCYVGLED